MAFVIDWVTQIIVFVLLAAVIDLLIPDNGMKKYVKLTVGLIMILIFLKPIFYLFQFDMPVALEQSYTELFDGENETESLENLIKIQKREIEDSQDAYILEQMTIQLTELANVPLRDEHQAEITDIRFLFTSGTEVNFENLEEVVVFVREANGRQGDIAEIDEVIINTEEKQVTEKQDVDEIKQLLHDVWELSDKTITVKWEGGTNWRRSYKNSYKP